MTISALSRPLMTLIGLSFGVAVAAVPGHAAPVPQARLVHCGTDTCLRIAGHRPDARVSVRIAGRDVAVKGGRDWHVTVPLAMARTWAAPAGGALPVVLADSRAMTETTQAVALPPGALGRHVELASLMVRAH